MNVAGRNPFADGAVAAGYEAWFETPLGGLVERLEWDLIRRMARPEPGERALDVGSGTGHFGRRLAHLGLRVEGVDPSDAMLAEARSRGGGVAYRAAAAELLPYDDGTFDLVLSVTVLEFLADPARALGEMTRVARPGGRVVVAVLNAASSWAEARRAEVARGAQSPFAAARFFGPGEFAQLLAASAGSAQRVRWSSALHIGPQGEGMHMAWILEATGRLLRRGRGALLVGRVET